MEGGIFLKIEQVYWLIIEQGHSGLVRTDNPIGSSRGIVVNLFAYGQRGPRFELGPPHFGFKDWISPASKLRNDFKNVKMM